nr:isochorismatase [uncultured bacterium]
MSPQELHAEVVDLLGEPVGADDDLLDAGLDSIRLMSLVERLRAGGHQVSFVELAETPTVNAWAALLERTA